MAIHHEEDEDEEDRAIAAAQAAAAAQAQAAAQKTGPGPVAEAGEEPDAMQVWNALMGRVCGLVRGQGSAQPSGEGRGGAECHAGVEWLNGACVRPYLRMRTGLSPVAEARNIFRATPAELQGS